MIVSEDLIKEFEKLELDVVYTRASERKSVYDDFSARIT